MIQILVVDDEAKIRMMIRKYAEFEGFFGHRSGRRHAGCDNLPPGPPAL